MIDGLDRLLAPARRSRPNGKTLTLDARRACCRRREPATRTVFVPGPHGGLTVVHGGGNTAARDRLRRWRLDRRLAHAPRRPLLDRRRLRGRPATIAGRRRGASTRTIIGFGNATCPFADPFPGCGVGSRMQLSAAPRSRPARRRAAVHVAEPEQRRSHGADERHGPAGRPARPADEHARRARSCFAAALRAAGLQGRACRCGSPASPARGRSRASARPRWRCRAPRSTPTLDRRRRRRATRRSTLTVFGYDPTLDGGVRMGGDTIVVCNRRRSPTSRAAARGTDRSPGRTRRSSSTATPRRTASGTAAIPYDVKGYEFGPKPFDPFCKIPDGENEDDEWVFPLADPYDFAGNDVIDASGLFAGRLRAACTLPTVGFTAYGGARQRPDHRQPGRRPPRRRLGRRHDPRPARRRPHLRRLRRQRRTSSRAALTVAIDERQPARRRSTRADPGGDQTIEPVPVAGRRHARRRPRRDLRRGRRRRDRRRRPADAPTTT